MHVDQLQDKFGSFYKSVRRGAVARPWAPAIVILAMISVIAPIKARAEFDLTVGALYRSYPLSGIAEVESGYGFLLWGTAREPFSGFIRPRIYANSAVSYNSLDGALEIFPLAFLGVRAGGEGIQNDRRYTSYDCETYQCLGREYRTYVETEFSLGAGPLFGQFQWRRESWSQARPSDGDFIDPTSGIVMAARGDRQTVFRGLIGLKLSDDWAVLGLYRYAQSEPGDISRSPTLFLRFRTGGLSMGVGGGAFGSPIKRNEANVQAYIRWSVWPSLALN